MSARDRRRLNDAFNEDVGRLLRDPAEVSDVDVISRLGYVPLPDADGTSLSKLPVKVKQATLTCTQFSLAGRDWELTPEFEGSLDELHHAITTTVPTEGKGAVDAQVLQFLDDYGSHLATQAVLGGRYKIECRVTAKENEDSESKKTAVAAALEFHASAAAAYAGFGGAGTAGASVAGSAHALRQKALQEDGKEHHAATTMSMVVTGGVPGDMAAWLNDLRQSNRGWEVVERSPHRGLCPIWDLVRKSKRLSPEQQKSVSDRIKARFEKEVAVELDASPAFVVRYMKATGRTYFEEIWIGEDGTLQFKQHHDSARKARLPEGLADFVSFVIENRTFVKAVGDTTEMSFEIDFTNKEMNLVNERALNAANVAANAAGGVATFGDKAAANEPVWTSAVAFAKDDRQYSAFVVGYMKETGDRTYFSESMDRRLRQATEQGPSRQWLGRAAAHRIDRLRLIRYR